MALLNRPRNPAAEVLKTPGVPMCSANGCPVHALHQGLCRYHMGEDPATWGAITNRIRTGEQTEIDRRKAENYKTWIREKFIKEGMKTDVKGSL